MLQISILLAETDQEKAEIFLKKMKSLLITGEYTIRPGWKNAEFDDEYPLREEQKRFILKSLTIDDCIKIEDNENTRYASSELFVFLKDVTLTVYGEDTIVSLYLKMYIQEAKTQNTVIVVSFHKAGLYD